MLRDHYRITTDTARVYLVRGGAGRRRYGWGWATATIREWPQGGQLDVQSDFGVFAYAWGAIGPRSLRQFLCELQFDYFMNKARPGGYTVFDVDRTIRNIKADIFGALNEERRSPATRAEAHEWRDDLDELADCTSEHVFAERLSSLNWFYEFYDGDYPSMVKVDCPQCRAFWDGPWQALKAYWLNEIEAEHSIAAE